MSRKKATVTVIAVSVVYAICWVPVLIMYCLAQSLPNQMIYSRNHKITIVLAMFNSSVNPVVYSFTSARFRQRLLELFNCKCSTRRSERQMRDLAPKTMIGVKQNAREETDGYANCV